MKVNPCSSFAQRWLNLFSWVDSLSQKIQAIWQKMWGNAPSSRYAFSQQINPDCHIQMWVNFNRLQELRAKNPARKLILEPTDFKTHRQWLGLTFSHFQRWLTALNGPYMRKYMEGALEQAPCAPEVFNPSGKRYIDDCWNPIERGERFVFTPTFLEQVDEDELSYTLPMYEDKGNYFCYNQLSKEYEPVKLDNRSPPKLDLSEGQRASLPSHVDTLNLIKLPGKIHLIQALDPGLAIGAGFVPLHLGTYKLLLLNFGLDAGHQQKNTDAILELQTAMRQTNSPWSLENCRKEYLMEHAITTMFQKDRALALKVQNHIDFFFRTWGRYEQDLYQLRNKQGHTFAPKAIDQYLPGKEQMLAYCLMKNIQFLWVSAISSTAFCRHLALPKFARWLPLTPGPSRYQKAAYQKKEGINFIQVWQEVASRLQAEFPQQKDWVSFSGHGMVFSFDSDLIQQQNKRSISNLKLAQDLGLAGIDSLYGKDMDVFYKIIEEI